MTNYETMMKQINRNRNIALSLGAVMVLSFPLCFNVLINHPSEYVSLSIGLGYALTGFLSIYFANK
jgi:hypothetical protein